MDFFIKVVVVDQNYNRGKVFELYIHKKLDTQFLFFYFLEYVKNTIQLNQDKLHTKKQPFYKYLKKAFNYFVK